jgi:hypothetical protein
VGGKSIEKSRSWREVSLSSSDCVYSNKEPFYGPCGKFIHDITLATTLLTKPKKTTAQNTREAGKEEARTLFGFDKLESDVGDCRRIFLASSLTIACSIFRIGQ